MVFLELAAAGIVYSIYKYWKERREEREAAEEEENVQEEQVNDGNIKEVRINNITVANMGTRDLVLDTLAKIGCKYTIEEGNNRICFNYQGENFVIDADNEYRMINVWDLWWGEQSLYDVDSLSRLKRAINLANINASTNIFYTVNNAEGIVGVHSRMNILFVPQIPNIEGFLQAMLAEFFATHRLVARELDKIKVEEEN